MNFKSLLCGAVLLLSVVAVGSAKSWNIVLDSKATAGAVQLPAGDYSLKLDGTQAVFTAADSGRKYNVSVKIETESKKFDETALENTTQGGMEVINSIDLGGTTTKLEFSK